MRIIRTISEASSDVWNGDVLLFRRRGLVSIAGRGDYAHAAMAAWWQRELMVLELREFLGGRAVTLASQLAHANEGIDVFRAEPSFVVGFVEINRAVEVMRRKLGKRYAWQHIAAAACLHLPLVRLFARPGTTEDPLKESRLPEHCSEAIANAYHVATGVDPVPSLAHRFTEPNDLARTTFFTYQFTLVPEVNPCPK